jgi:hypothetical protein
LGRPNGAADLNRELIAMASTRAFDDRLDIFFMHRYLQVATLEGLQAGGAETADLCQVWRDELEPLQPVPNPLEVKISATPSAAHGQPPSVAEITKTGRIVGPGAAQQASLNVFVSYSHHDEKMRVKLGQHLAPLVDDGLIRIWHDREIEAGADWEGEINNEIAAADIILLLVSASFLNSRYCRSELQKALKLRGAGKALPIPIILRDCDWTSVFNTAQYKIQALPRDDRPVAGGSWANHDAAYATIVKELRAKIEKLRRGIDTE